MSSKMRIFPLYIIFTILTGCISPAGERETEGLVKVFVTANILNVRESPGVNSPIIMRLPYGTPLLVKSSISPEGAFQLSEWLLAPSIGGYISSEFVRTNRPAHGRKRMVLRRLDESGACETDALWQFVQVLDLHDGVASLNRVESFSMEKEIRTSFYGIYSIEGTVIKVDFEKGSQSVLRGVLESERLASGPTTIDGFSLRLRYNPEVDGFLYPGEEAILRSNRENNYSVRNCAFVPLSFRDRESLSEMCRGLEALTTVSWHGYFCTRS